ncbi:MAG TPA: ABC transporter permease subunit [Pseudonocardiaceae bacterium]
MHKQRRANVRGLIGLAGFLVLWELASRTHIVDPRYIPAPSTMAGEVGRLFSQPQFSADFIATVLAWFIVMLISVAIALPLGMLLGSIPGLRVATSAIVEFIRPVPAVTLIPVVIVAFGDGAQTKIILAVFTSIWPILFNVIYGLHEVDPQYVDTAQVFRTRQSRIALAVKLPAVMPFAMTGIRLSAAMSLITILSTEFLDGSGIGFGAYIYSTGSVSGNMVIVVTGVVLAGILGYLVNLGLTVIQNAWFAWSPESRVS